MRFRIFIILLFFRYFIFGQDIYISSGFLHSAYVCSNGNIYTWGDNTYDQLGRESGNTVEVNKYIDSVIQVSAGFGFHTMVLRQDSSVWGWGANHKGQIGNINDCVLPECETTVYPVRVKGGETGDEYLSNVTQISAGEFHTLALLANGTVVAWGNNEYGQLGNGSSGGYETSPVFVMNSTGDTLNDIIAVAAGANHSYALSSEGFVYAWGKNQYKQLADGTTVQKTVAILIQSDANTVLSGIVSIAGGGEHGLFIHNSGRLYGVGAYNGLVTDGETIFYSPETYAQLIEGGETGYTFLENVVAINAGYYHSLAIIEINGVNYAVSWGDNVFYNLYNPLYGGQLGTGSSSTQKLMYPAFVRESEDVRLRNVRAISAGGGTSMFEIFDTDSKEDIFYVCGANNLYQLGDDSREDQYYPIELDLEDCAPLCPGAYLGSDLQLCEPIVYTLKSGYTSSDYYYEWTLNDTLIASGDYPSIEIVKTGTYALHMSSSTNICPEIDDEVVVQGIEKDFEVLTRTYCDNSLVFEVYGNNDYVWYPDNESTDVLGIGTIVTIPQSFAEEVIADSLYRLWVEQTDVCQRIPVYCIKKCTDCNTPQPELTDSLYCRSDSYSISFEGTDIYWFSDINKTKFLHYGNTYEVTDLQLGDNWFYVTETENFCESEIDSFKVELKQCSNVYSIEGKVILPDDDITGKIMIYYSDNLNSAYTETQINTDGSFALQVEEGYIYVCFIPDSDQETKKIWFGNTYLLDDALQIYVQADIINLKIEYPSTSISENDSKDSPIKIYSQANILYISTAEEILTISLYDIKGKLLRYENVHSDQFEISVSALHQPLFIKVQTNSEIYFHKFLNY